MTAVRPYYFPPTLVFRQASSALLFGWLIRWRRLAHWVFRDGFRTVPVAAGAVGMGCIGFPAHPAWEVTAACNLRCIHCHASGGKAAPDELTTREAKGLIDELAGVREFRMLVYTGGEPLVRPDIFELLEHSRRVGFRNVIATNATLIDGSMARRLKKAGVVGAAVSLDATDEQGHDRIRGVEGAFERCMRGMEAIREAGILLQVNVTAMEYNFPLLGEIIDLSERLGASIMLMYQLVPVGRGHHIDKAALDREKNKRLLRFLLSKQRTTRPIVEPVAGPQYWPLIVRSKGITNGPVRKLAGSLFHGCSAGRGFIYIKPNGDVWPCPFVEVNCGNVRETGFAEIWRNSLVLDDLRHRGSRLKGACGSCSENDICGGCRGRAWAYHGDYLAEDPSCFLREHKEADTPVFHRATSCDFTR